MQVVGSPISISIFAPEFPFSSSFLIPPRGTRVLCTEVRDYHHQVPALLSSTVPYMHIGSENYLDDKGGI